MENKNEVVVREGSSPAEMIRLAVEGKADLDKLEKLLTLQERWEANEAKKAYHIALSNAKGELPQVIRDKENKQYGSTYVSKNQLIRTITPVLSKYGISATYQYSNPSEKSVTVTCKLTHKQGHSEETSFTAPADISGAKNPIQQLKSTRTYLEKMTLEGVLGIESADDVDDDGNGSGGVEYLTDEQKNELLDLMADANMDIPKFYKYFGVEGIDTFPAKELPRAKIAIDTKKKKDKAKGGK